MRSPWSKSTFYYGANVVFQTGNLGANWEPISKDLTNGDPAKWAPSGGPVFTDNSSSEYSGVLTQIAESPAQRGLIWTGSDDGNVQVTENGGGKWMNVGPNIGGVPAHSPVSAVEPSRRNAKTTYVFGLKNLPDVPVRDIFLQAKQNDIIVATHGRGLWILDDAAPVQGMAAAAGKAATLFPIRPALRFASRATRSDKEIC